MSNQTAQELIASARRDPEAKTAADLVGPSQLASIRNLSRQLGVDPDEECQRVLLCNSDALSKTAATAFIFHLESLQQERQTA